MLHSSQLTAPLEEILDEAQLADRLKTSVASIRWMRRTGSLSYIKIAGNRKVRFRWSQVIADLRASEVRASVHADPRAAQLADIAAMNGEDAAEIAIADSFREFPDIQG
jgi:hypothetical protein